MAKASNVETTNTVWNSTAPLGEFRPYVRESADVPEFTFKAILFGAIFGVIFGAVTVYVGLRAGLTVSASIPIAVLSISLLRAFGKASILENNIVQTAGSAGESVAAGAIFTLPALIFMGFPFEYSRIFLLALIGGWIGVLFMIPLRRQLIVQEHGNLLYPEGTACADVLVAGEKGGSFASRVFWGLGLGGIYTFLMATAQVWKQRPLYEPAWLPGASFRAEITSEYLGVGYIIGPRIAGTIFAGGVFSWLVLMPAIKFFGEGLAAPLYPSTIPVRDMTPGQLWESYIRPMGAGAVAMAGLITLMKTMPTIVNALRSGMKDIRSQQGGVETGGRQERDISMKWVVLGSLAIVVAMWLMLTFNPIAGARTSAFENVIASLFVVIFGFLFVTVSSRICGLIGTSANPVSGMTIATLMATCAMFLAMGWTAPAYSALAITIGGVVCVAAANAGATSQDLKTGFLIGATPYRQQWALMIGVMVSVFVIGGTLMLMNFGLSEFRPMQRALDIDKVRAEQSLRGAAVRVEKELDDPHPQTYRDKKYILVNALGSRELPDGKYLYDPDTRQIEVQWITGIGSDKAAAPQGRLMATVITGILNQRLPWRLVAMGVFLVIAVELLGIRSLSFAVGSYLGLHTTLAIFCGGLVRWAAERGRQSSGSHAESDVSPGSLFASGLIAAGGVMGLIAIVINVLGDPELGIKLIPPGVLAFGPKIAPGVAASNVFAVVMFALLGYSLYYFARKKLD
ncbi:MAG TPA: oligopeptide transporter, OPT family [Vicinamibacterales bacterium]|nr:oligopeptide transporter, OPT family [Vicinamibacterales bacterium]